VLRALPARRRAHLRNTIVLILSANPAYAVRGVRPGARLRHLARRVRAGKGFRVGRNTWYLFGDGPSRGVFDVRGGVIREAGIADRALTATGALSRRFLRSFS
jgi:hypothetical protein